MMEEEFVRKRGWITQAEFLDRLAAANLIPGPSSTEVAIFIGQSLRGWAGLIVAGASFTIPAAVLVSFIAAAYVRYGALPQVAGILAAIKPAVIAIISQALWKLAPSAAKTKTLAVIGVVAALLSFFGVGPLPVLAFAGAASGIVWWAKRAKSGSAAAIISWLERCMVARHLGGRRRHGGEHSGEKSGLRVGRASRRLDHRFAGETIASTVILQELYPQKVFIGSSKRSSPCNQCYAVQLVKSSVC